MMMKCQTTPWMRKVFSMALCVRTCCTDFSRSGLVYVSCMVNEPVAPAGWLNATTLTVRRYLDTSETEKAVEVEGLLPGIFSLAQSINIYIYNF